MNPRLTFLLPGVLCFAAGVLLRDVAQDYRPPTFAECVRAEEPTPRVKVLPDSMRAPLDLICEHYKVTGEAGRCSQVES